MAAGEDHHWQGPGRPPGIKLISWAVLAVVAVAGVVVVWLTASAATQEERQADERASSRVGGAVAAAVDRTVTAMAGASAVLADGRTIDPQLFAAYAREIVAESPIVALAAVTVVGRERRDQFEAQSGVVIVDLAPDGFVPAASRDAHWVVADVQPATPSSSAIVGFDLLSEANRADTLRRSRDGGAPEISAPTASQPSGAPAVFVARPLFLDREVPAELSQRRSSLVGFVTTSLPGDVITATTVADVGPSIRFTVADGDVVLAATGERPADDSPLTVIDVGGRRWLLRVDDRQSSDWTDTTFAAVAGAAVLVAAAVVLRRRDRRSAEHDRVARLEHRLITELYEVSLTPPTVSADLDVAVHYETPAEGLAIGGDWYDVFTGPTGRLTVIVGDVAGHGIDSAVTMIELRSLLRAMVMTGRSLDAAAGVATTALVEAPVIRMASVVLMDIDPASGAITYCNAGHPPPLLMQADGTVSQLETGRRPMLGIGDFGRFPIGHAELGEGSTLVVYTDGLVERRDIGIDVAIDALAGVVGSAGDLGDAELLCGHIVQAQRMTVPPDDDRAVVVIRRPHVTAHAPTGSEPLDGSTNRAN